MTDHEMRDNPLYEYKHGIWYYAGLETETDEEHKRKCPACNLVPSGMIYAHGQKSKTVKDAYRALFSGIEQIGRMILPMIPHVYTQPQVEGISEDRTGACPVKTREIA